MIPFTANCSKFDLRDFMTLAKVLYHVFLHHRLSLIYKKYAA